MDDKFGVDRKPEMSDARYEMWLKHEERRRNQLVGAVTFIGFVAIIAVTVVVIAWGPWNG